MIKGKNDIAVGGGKGGVGESVLACNLAVGFAREGSDVVLVDADLGAPNLHTLAGIELSRGSLGDLLSNSELHLANLLMETGAPGLRMACGAAPIMGVANPELIKKQRLINEISTLDELRLDVSKNPAAPEYIWVPATIRYYDRRSHAAGCQLINRADMKSAVDAAASELGREVTPLPIPSDERAAGGV